MKYNFKRAGVLLALLILLSMTKPAFGQGAGRETPKPSTTKPPASKSAPRKLTTRSTSRTFRPTNPHIQLVTIAPGSFMMGSPSGENGRDDDEGPQHRVNVRGFYLGKFEVTQAEFRSVTGKNPSRFSGCENCPVENVSWNDAREFVRILNGLQVDYVYRLPSEAEWEYACRAGTTSAFAFGKSISPDQANWGGYHGDKTAQVGSYRPNDFGVYDMSGNVWEWCEDYYHENYTRAPTDGSAWLRRGRFAERITRSGSWTLDDYMMRSGSRGRFPPDRRNDEQGFRVAADAGKLP